MLEWKISWYGTKEMRDKVDVKKWIETFLNVLDILSVRLKRFINPKYVSDMEGSRFTNRSCWRSFDGAKLLELRFAYVKCMIK